MSQFKPQFFVVDDKDRLIPSHIYWQQKRLAEASAKAEAEAKKIKERAENAARNRATISPEAWDLYKWLRKRVGLPKRAISLREICKNAVPTKLRKSVVALACLQELVRAGLACPTRRRLTYENHQVRHAYEVT